jgi:type IV pilus assembly protein PilY1
MSGTDGSGISRLNRMKVALNNMLDSVNNVNVGLMRFTNPGGPILYPVSYIDAADSEVLTEKVPEVQVNLIGSANDAAELRCVDVGTCSTFEPEVGSMDLTAPKLEVTGVSGFGTTGSIDVQIAESSDDAESTGPSNMYTTSTDLDMSTNGAGADNRIGLRFQKLDIPPKATIIHAELDFYAVETLSTASTLTIRAHNVDDSPTFPSSSGADDIESRLASATSASVDWTGISPWAVGDRYQSPELKSVVQEVVSRPGWLPGNDLSFLITGTTGSARRAGTYDDLPARAAVLRVDYAVGDSGIQRIGLRFEGVNVPQGVDILNAWLELTPTEDTDVDMKFKIYAEDTGFSKPFSTTPYDISSRLGTSEEQWDLQQSNAGDVWAQDNPEITPNLKSVVQQVVDRGDWCGGNAMTFFLMWDGNRGPRTIHSFDGDPSKAPKLRIDYDQGSLPGLSPGEGCMIKTTQAQIKASKDDAEQRTDQSSVTTSSSDLDMMDVSGGKKITVGLRFQDLPIKQGAVILSAELEFTAKESHSTPADFFIYGHATDDADEFTAGAGKDVKSRTKTSDATKVNWVVPSWSAGETYATPDISGMVQEIVDRGGWTDGNDMAFILTGTGVRKAYTNDKGGAGKAAVLRLTYQGEIGSDTITDTVTVRQRLKDIIADLDNNGGTPIVDTLYEAALYYRGEDLEYGDTRNNRAYTRVSHPASYTGGTVDRDSKCTDANLNDESCKTEKINDDPIYTSPIESQVCQSNFIVVLTDGQANNNHSQGLVKAMTGDSSCIDTFSNGDDVLSGDECGVELTKFLNENDQSKVEGKNVVTTYTIGFNFTSQFIKQLATDGGGSFFEASTADELTAVFNQILDDVLDRTTSFAAPALSVNAFNKLFHRNEVFFSLFTPGRDTRWEGNVKKYQLCERTVPLPDPPGPDIPADCSVLGEVLDFSSPRKPAIGGDERIADDAKSDWTTTADGPEIMEGGAGNKVPTHVDRRIFTYTGSGAPSGVDLTTGTAHKVQDSNTDITVALLGGTTVAGPDFMSAADRTKVINWMRGMDTMDEDLDGDETDDRYAFHDPLHSSPVAVTYGGDDANPIIKLFVGTNDGGLRMINTYNGTEEWIFFPQQVLSGQRKLMNNPLTDHFYGIDATPTIWINDENFDGVIDPLVDANLDGTKEFVRAIVGMRRGGSNYYAIDATPTSKLTSPAPVNGVNPKLLWRIDGGSTDFPQLGQTWSQPKITMMKKGTTVAGQTILKRVMVFAGGYDQPFQDDNYGPSSPGNAIYVVDPEDGSRLFWISGDDHGGSEGVVIPDMTYPIPSDLALMDADGDGATDRIYVGDTGGQVWRVDIGADVTDSAGFKATVGKLATVADQFELEDQRKFFYPPDVVRVEDSYYSSDANYDLVTIASGNRSHPLNSDVQDRFYAFRDVHQAALVDGDPLLTSDDDGLADGYTTLQGKTVAIQPGDLFDVTDINDPTGTDLTDLKAANGYFIDLEGLGEKGLSSPITLGGTVFFTSYTPEDVLSLSDCSLAEGGGTVYAFNVLNGAAAYNWDGIGDDTNLAKSDRTQTLGAGIPSSAVPIFQEEGISILIGGGGGAKTLDPDIELPRERTYWGHEDS